MVERKGYRCMMDGCATGGSTLPSEDQFSMVDWSLAFDPCSTRATHGNSTSYARLEKTSYMFGLNLV